MPYRILTVCTGNICRSPAMQLRLAAALDDSVEVTSAGTGAVVGHPVSEPMARLLAADGFDPGGFTARQLTPALAAGADLVLTATPAHRSVVVEAAPGALRRTLALAELARLASGIDPAALAALPPGDDAVRLPALVALALRERPRYAGGTYDDAVADPYSLGDRAYRESYEHIGRAVGTLVRALRG